MRMSTSVLVDPGRWQATRTDWMPSQTERPSVNCGICGLHYWTKDSHSEENTDY